MLMRLFNLTHDLININCLYEKKRVYVVLRSLDLYIYMFKIKQINKENFIIQINKDLKENLFKF